MNRLPFLLTLLFTSLLAFGTSSCDDPAADRMRYSADVCKTLPAFVKDMKENGEEKIKVGGQPGQMERNTKLDVRQSQRPIRRKTAKMASLRPQGNCAPESYYLRQFTIAPPRTGELVLHVASDFTGYYYVSVYGVNGENVVPLTECSPSRAIHHILHVPAKNGQKLYDFLLIDVRYETGRVLDANPKDAFISLSAYDGSPKATEEAAKKGFKDDCGDGPNCYVLSTCDRSLNLEQWANELGLRVIDQVGGEGQVVNACVPEGFSVQTTTPRGGAKAKVIERDTTGGDMERNFFIEVEEITPNPGYGEIRDKQITAAFPCLEYRPRNGGGDPLMVTIIDSGVDASDLSFRPWDEYDARRNYSQYLRAGTFGYDFVNDDPEPDDELNHGTYVGGALIADYKGDDRLTVVHHKIFDGDGRATYFGAVEAIYAAIEHETNILSLSWGITDQKEPFALKCALREAMDKKVMVVTSAGNASSNIDARPQWPAGWTNDRDFPYLFAVGSYYYPNLENPATFRANYSNFGERRVSYYGYLTMLVPEYQVSTTTLAFGTSISVPLVVANIAERYRSAGRERTRAETFTESGPQFFPSWLRDGAGQPIGQHQVEVLPVDCAPKRP